MNPAVSINSDVASVGHFQITVAQTGRDTASLDIREWPPGVSVGPAHTDQTYELTDIKVNVLEDLVTCKTTSFFLAPVLTFWLSKTGMTPSVTVEVTHLLFKDTVTTYALSGEDRKALSDFLAQAQFPATTQAHVAKHNLNWPTNDPNWPYNVNPNDPNRPNWPNGPTPAGGTPGDLTVLASGIGASGGGTSLTPQVYPAFSQVSPPVSYQVGHNRVPPPEAPSFPMIFPKADEKK